MDILDALNNAARFAADRWQAARSEGSEEDTQLWMRVSEFRSFVGETGQVYGLETYMGEDLPPVSPALAARADTISYRIMGLLLRASDEASEPQQKQSAFTLIGMLNFLADAGQLDAVEDYINHRLEYAPLAIARFTSHGEAKAWLDGLAEPLSPVLLLIGDVYFRACWSREISSRCIYRDYVIEPYIQELVASGIPAATPAFGTREEAGQWLLAHPASPFAFVSIRGEYHVAVHHKRLGIHTLHPVAAALREWERMKAASEAD